MNRKLTLKQLRFIESYLATSNATQSYVAAGYKGRGHIAEVEASRLLRNPEVQRVLRVARTKAAAKLDVTAESVVRGMKNLATFRGKGWSHMAAVRATELLGRMFNLFGEKRQHEHSGPEGKPFPYNDQRLTDRIDSLTDAFLGAARRSIEGAVSGDDPGKPLDPG